jgi:hypothetical protein
VLDPFALTVPFNVAVVWVIAVAGFVTTPGALPPPPPPPRMTSSD